MTDLLLAQTVALMGLAVAVAGLTARWRETGLRSRPVDHAPARGDVKAGIRYAFTLGMAPWTKESTRIHAAAYLRGVGFHAGIFAGLAVLAARPWWPGLPPVARTVIALGLAAGALLGAAGSVMRLREPHLRALSTMDDHVSIWLVTVFLGLTGLAVWQPRFVVSMYVAAGVMMAYIPFGKIRHCLYFFVARGAFGRFVGRRGVLPHPAAIAKEGVR